jgi:GNAT superfamily N-acetyltransferase
MVASRGEFGVAGAVRPARGAGSERIPDRCLRGHVLAVAGATNGWSHAYGLPTVTCEVCSVLYGAAAATWCLLDPVVRYRLDEMPEQGLVLVMIPPAHPRAGVGRVELRLNREPVAAVWLAVCPPCRRVVLTDLRVGQDWRRRGYGRVLVASALAFAGPSVYRWSTVRLPDALEAHAFWSALGGFPTLGSPGPCSDMVELSEITPARERGLWARSDGSR